MHSMVLYHQELQMSRWVKKHTLVSKCTKKGTFGNSIQMSEDLRTIVVAGVDELDKHYFQPSLYIFKKYMNRWVEEQKLVIGNVYNRADIHISASVNTSGDIITLLTPFNNNTNLLILKSYNGAWCKKLDLCYPNEVPQDPPALHKGDMLLVSNVLSIHSHSNKLGDVNIYISK